MLNGTAGADIIKGLAGNDVINGGAGNDNLSGDEGIDMVSYSNATAAVTVDLSKAIAQNTVGAGTDTLSGFEGIIGSAFNDTLRGDANANTFEGGAGNDYMNGASGYDTVSYANAGGGITIDLNLTTAQNTGGAGTDTLFYIEYIIGSSYNDVFT